VDSVYNRAKDLREKVESIMLKKIEWQILFSVDGKRSISQIASKVQRDEDFVTQVLQSLAGQQLLTGGSPAGNGAEPTKEVKKKEEPKVEKVVEKVKAEKKEEKKETPKETKPVVEKPVQKKESFDLGAMETPKTETKATATPAKTTAAAAKGGKKILVVDDSIVIQKMVEIALENETYQLTGAMKGEEAVRMAKETQPSLILLDIMLPDMSGIDVMKGIRALGAPFDAVPIVILSGKDSPQDKDAAISNGANDFLTKPFHDEDLLSKVHEYLG